MANWSFEVRHGRLDRLPTGIAGTVEDQQRQKSAAFFVAEAGNLLNEPEDRIVKSINAKSSGLDAIASLAHVCSWLFGMLECEIDHYFQCNYLRLTFVNLTDIARNDDARSGMMTTNSADLPSPSEHSLSLIIHQFVMTLRVFFTQLQGCVEAFSTDADLHVSDWVTVTFNRAA